MNERWLPVPGYEGLYEVSSLGRVRSFYRGCCVLRPCRDKDGYPMVALNRAGVRKTYILHRIVCRAFNGPPNALHKEAAHLDGNRENCAADNLKWVSRVENCSHKLAHGTHQSGDRAGQRKLNSSQVEIIRKRGATARQFAKAYGVSRYAIYDIWRGRNWKSPTAESGDAQ